jgi:cob(I)alamin adenosyltransferase
VGNRLSKIYTKTGDDGTTGLGDGTRTGKDAPRVEAYGTVDEANSTIGLLLAAGVPNDVRELLTRVQHQLFDLGGELCIPGLAAIFDADIDALEAALDAFNADLPPLKDFILPGGGEAAARCHVARTVVRRAERATVALSRLEQVRPQPLCYLNRLSDLLFVAARLIARRQDCAEILWQPAATADADA